MIEKATGGREWRTESILKQYLLRGYEDIISIMCAR